ncbi:tRNA (guanine(46)-N(7))-methyltransferase TrmB [Synoicihabitans lomoniglobus]|uniref:tRNA (guanine(46)-N(7))-methyltransferase n=1 Tax=Synoicihabitans lomoniglobus TaxID=2909285 RepID=A0AAE9ZSQ9_9BACT|nr:methyltransferase domain-containing protein [Opitutaceae bacterium LMO-M01]WED64530.1 methyltransferase domain-containing protein [Opitutaceae bacterium LMO-M01]
MSIEDAHAIHQQRVTALHTTLAQVPLDSPALTLEIGCGHGHFLTAYAAAHPGEHCLAIDIIKERLEKAARKTDRAELTNVSWIRAAAEDLVEALPAGVRFNRNIFVLFPDPWPKRRHWKNRLIQPAFLDTLAQLSAASTRLCFRTDHAPYFASARDTVDAHPRWRLTPEESWPFEQTTVFEQKAASFQSFIARPIENTETPAEIETKSATSN